METRERYKLGHESIVRAKSGQSIGNDMAVIQGFTAKGIDPEEIHPRDNVFTFWGWKALGRRVKKGEHGVALTVWITKDAKPDPNLRPGEMSSARKATYPKHSTVFHVSQTEPERGTA